MECSLLLLPLIKMQSLSPCCGSASHPYHLDADPDPTFHSDADPDPTFQSDADPDPTTNFSPDLDPSMLQNDPLKHKVNKFSLL
jgi:hypothetical protein